MANPLIKQNEHGYGYGQGYGYGEHVPLLASGKRNLTIALLILFLGLAWLGFRFLVWQETRQLTAAAVSWERGEASEAWEHLENVGLWAVDSERFQKTRLTLLLERDPTAAAVYAQLAISHENFVDYKDPAFFWKALLLAPIRSQNWQALEANIEKAQQAEALPQNSPEMHLAQAWLLLSKGQDKEAWDSLQAALERNPYDSEARLLRSELQALSRNRSDRNQALVSLREIRSEQGPDSVRASLLLLTSGLLPEIESDWKAELEAVALNPYLDEHYLFSRPTALRAVTAKIRGKSPEMSYRFTKQLSELSIASETELAEYAFSAQEMGELEEAKQAIQSYSENSRAAPLENWLLARQAWYEEDLTAALAGAEKGLETDQAKRFLPLLASFAKEQTFEVPDVLQKQAMSLIIQYGDLTNSQWEFAARKLWSLDESKQDELIQQALSRTETAPLFTARFLLEHLQADQALIALEAVPLPLPNEAIELKFRALVLQKSYQEAKRILADSPNITPFTRLSGTLMLALLTGDKQSVQQAWENTWNLAETLRSPAAFAALGDLSFEYNANDLALSAYQKAKSLAPALPIAAASLQRYAKLELERKQTSEALSLLSQALLAEPNSDKVLSQWSYYSTLLNTDLLLAKDRIRTLFDKRKNDPGIVTTMAFAYLRTGQKARALALLEPIANSQLQTDAGKAILYAALIANDENERAATLRSEIRDALLLPEELALIEEYNPVVTEEIELEEVAEDIRLIDLQKSREQRTQ